MAVATRIVDRPRNYFIGSYAGTTAAQKIHIGFKPAFILAVNWTDGDQWYLWTKNDTANINIVTTAAANSATAITQADDGTVLGFALAASDAIANENGKTYYFIAFPE